MQDSDLFGISNNQFIIEDVYENIKGIPGLTYKPDYITKQEEKKLIDAIDKETWLDDLSRRVQHYGYKYDYTARRINLNMKIGSLPDWILPLSEKLTKDGFFKKQPDQVIINEYKSGQGIADHIDCEPCFEDTIVSLSLLDSVVMDFTEAINKKNRVEVPLFPRSIIILKEDARYDWKHGIKKRKKHKYKKSWEGELNRRISLTFRRVIIH